MLVWQDMVNGGGTVPPRGDRAPAVLSRCRCPTGATGVRPRRRQEGRGHWLAELRGDDRAAAQRRRPSRCGCRSTRAGGSSTPRPSLTRSARLDPTRTVDHASGWHDQGARGSHQPARLLPRLPRAPRRRRRPAPRRWSLSEYGGYSQRLAEHSTIAREFGSGAIRCGRRSRQRYRAAHAADHPRHRRGLSATVYTQLSDVEDETNGLLSYDRRTGRSTRRRCALSCRWRNPDLTASVGRPDLVRGGEPHVLPAARPVRRVAPVRVEPHAAGVSRTSSAYTCVAAQPDPVGARIGAPCYLPVRPSGLVRTRTARLRRASSRPSRSRSGRRPTRR